MVVLSEAGDFNRRRESQNALVMDYADVRIKRFFSLDDQVYRDGELDRRTKELIGLVSSLVLRCDDCVRYHLMTCHELGVGTAQVMEAMSVGLVVGGSIVIPHLRRAVEFWDGMDHSSEADGK